MKAVYIGIDAHKDSNVIGLAFSRGGKPELYGKAPGDIPGFIKVLRRILKKYDLRKQDVALCYEAGQASLT